MSLTDVFDDIVASTEVLTAGTEAIFESFVSKQIDFHKEVDSVKAENNRLKGENEARDIKLKLSRNSLEQQMNENADLKERIKEYEKQFTILKVLITSEDKIENLNEAERRSLALLTKTRSSLSPCMYSESMEQGVTPDSSVNITDATDLDDDEGAHVASRWKRRRTASTEWTLDSSQLSKKKRSIEDQHASTTDENQEPLFGEQPTPTTTDVGMGNMLEGETLHTIQPLCRQFKKPPPGKNRRRPSQGHLQKRIDVVEDQEMPPVVPPLDIPLSARDEGSPPVIPSAPSELEVRMAMNESPSHDQYHHYMSPLSPTTPTNLPVVHSPLTPTNLPMLHQPIHSPVVPVVSAGNLYPVLDDQQQYDVTPAATPVHARSEAILTRRHDFAPKTVMKAETCEVCKKKVTFGRNCLKCKDCRATCHAECKDGVPLPCVPTVHTPKKRQKDSELAAFCPHSIPRVPSLVVHCIREIESRGLNQVGVYRIPGSERSIKELKDRLLRTKGTPNMDRVEDINVICGCLKQFLIGLKEPLVTRKLNPLFLQAVDEESNENTLVGVLEAVAQLPPCNKDTLAFIMLHLQKVTSCADVNKMSVASLAKVFAPTIIGSVSTKPSEMLRELPKQQKVVECLLGISPEYWHQYLSPEDNPDPASPTLAPNMVSSLSAPNFASPSTPELMPVPQSPFLGPCQSPIANRYRTPVVTRSISSRLGNPTNSVKKGNTFFAAIN